MLLKDTIKVSVLSSIFFKYYFKYMKINELFSKNLIRIRKSKGLSQRKLAKLTGLTQRIINSYENNPEYIPLEKIKNLTDALNIHISELFNDLNKNKKNKLIDEIDVRWLRKIEEIKKLSEFDQKEISRHINYLVDKNKQKKKKQFADSKK